MRKVLYKSELRCYNKKKQLHNDCGPARIIFDIKKGIPFVVCQEWYKDGKRHRLDGPAVITFFRGTNRLKSRAWFVNGKQHRVDGPALEYKSMDGELIIRFYKYNKPYPKEEWFDSLTDKEKLQFILKG